MTKELAEILASEFKNLTPEKFAEFSQEKKEYLTILSMSSSGPLPPPFLLAQYENLFPGATERIIKIVEKNQEHRIACNNKLIEAEINNEKCALNLQKPGLWLSFAAILVITTSSVLLSFFGSDLASFAAIIGGIAAVITALLAGKKFTANHIKAENTISNKTKNHQ